jgi:hypothetical protein
MRCNTVDDNESAEIDTHVMVHELITLASIIPFHRRVCYWS